MASCTDVAALQDAVKQAAARAALHASAHLPTHCGSNSSHDTGTANGSSGAVQQTDAASASFQLPYEAIWLKRAARAVLVDPDPAATCAEQPSLAGRLLQHPACEVRAAAAREMLAQARSGQPKL